MAASMHLDLAAPDDSAASAHLAVFVGAEDALGLFEGAPAQRALPVRAARLRQHDPEWLVATPAAFAEQAAWRQVEAGRADTMRAVTVSFAVAPNAGVLCAPGVVHRLGFHGGARTYVQLDFPEVGSVHLDCSALCAFHYLGQLHATLADGRKVRYPFAFSFDEAQDRVSLGEHSFELPRALRHADNAGDAPLLVNADVLATFLRINELAGPLAAVESGLVYFVAPDGRLMPHDKADAGAALAEALVEARSARNAADAGSSAEEEEEEQKEALEADLPLEAVRVGDVVRVPGERAAAVVVKPQRGSELWEAASVALPAEIRRLRGDAVLHPADTEPRNHFYHLYDGATYAAVERPVAELRLGDVINAPSGAGLAVVVAARPEANEVLYAAARPGPNDPASLWGATASAFALKDAYSGGYEPVNVGECRASLSYLAEGVERKRLVPASAEAVAAAAAGSRAAEAIASLDRLLAVVEATPVKGEAAPAPKKAAAAPAAKPQKAAEKKKTTEKKAAGACPAAKKPYSKEHPYGYDTAWAPDVPAGHTPYSWDEEKPPAAAAAKAAEGDKPAQGKKGKKDKKQKQPKQQKKGGAAADIPPFNRLAFTVGRVTAVEKHPDADSMWVEQIDLGEPTGPRQICSGLFHFVPKDEFMGAMVVVASNLKPAVLRGIESNGMVLAASNEDHTKVALVVPAEGAQPGDRIYLDGASDEERALPADASVNAKKKNSPWAKASPDLATNADGVVTFAGRALVTDAGAVRCPSLPSAIVK